MRIENGRLVILKKEDDWMNEPLKPTTGIPSALELELQNQLKEFKIQIQSLTDSMREKDEYIAKLEMQMLEAESKSVSFSQNTTTNVVKKFGLDADDINNLRSKLMEKDGEINKLQMIKNQIKSKESRITQLTGENERLRKKIQDDLLHFKQELDPLRKEASRAKLLDMQVKTYKDRVEKTADSLNTQITQLKLSLSNYEKIMNVVKI